jgi:hypothetical protein
MAVDAFQTMMLRQLVSDLRNLDAAIDGRTRHARMLTSANKSFDPRNLLETATRLDREAEGFLQLLTALQCKAEVMRRVVSNRPPAQITIGKFTQSAGGELAEIAALCGRLQRDSPKLHMRASRLRGAASKAINLPTRMPDPLSHAPIIEIIDTAVSIVEALVDFREMCRSGRLRQWFNS